MSEVENAKGKEMIIAGERAWVEAEWAGNMQEAITRVREFVEPYKDDEVMDWFALRILKLLDGAI